MVHFLSGQRDFEPIIDCILIVTKWYKTRQTKSYNTMLLVRAINHVNCTIDEMNVEHPNCYSCCKLHVNRTYSYTRLEITNFH